MAEFEVENEGRWKTAKRLGAIGLGILGLATNPGKDTMPVRDLLTANAKAEYERRRTEDAVDENTPRQRRHEVDERLVLDELIGEAFIKEPNQEDEPEEQRAKRIVTTLVQKLRKELVPSTTKQGKSGSNVRSRIDSRVGAELVRIANNLSAHQDLIKQAHTNNVGLRTLENTLRAAGNLMIVRAKSNKHPDRREMDI